MIPKIGLRRSVLYVPGNDLRKLKSSIKSNADCLVYDLEDSVPSSMKQTARLNILKHLESHPSHHEHAIRINSIGSGYEIHDLEHVLSIPHINTIMIPKVNSSLDVHKVVQYTKKYHNKIHIIACIESAKGVLNLEDIAQSDPSLTALLFAAEDYCADLNLLRTRKSLEMIYARQKLVTVAKAYGLESIDKVCIDYKDFDILNEECVEARQFGFCGKQAIHPSQIKLIHDAFSPSKEEVDRAFRIVGESIEYAKRGLGAFDLDGKVVDAPVIKWATLILEKHEYITRHGNSSL